MKKIFALVCTAALCIGSAYANDIALKSTGKMLQPGSWGLYVPGMIYMPNDRTEVMKVRFMVNETFDKNGKALNSDKMVFTCNGQESPLNFETWAYCDVEPGQLGGVRLYYSDYKNGAGGLYEHLN